jgi:hypothetical protein
MNRVQLYETFLLAEMSNRELALRALKEICADGVVLDFVRDFVWAGRLFSAVLHPDYGETGEHPFLGKPDRVLPADGSPSNAERERYHLPLWPQLEWELKVINGRFVGRAGFVREAGAAVRPGELAGVVPWQVVEDDIPFLCSESVRGGGSWYPRTEYYCRLREPANTELFLIFDLGLLQEVRLWAESQYYSVDEFCGRGARTSATKTRHGSGAFPGL